MKFLYSPVYLIIFIHFLRMLARRLSPGMEKYSLAVCDCTSGDDEPRKDSRFYVVRKAGAQRLFWFRLDCSETVAVDITKEFMRRNPILLGQLEIHRAPCTCGFESIRGWIGFDRGDAIVSSMYDICSAYRREHPGADIRYLPGM